MAKANDLNIYKCVTYPLAHRQSADMSGEQSEILTLWSEEVPTIYKN